MRFGAGNQLSIGRAFDPNMGVFQYGSGQIDAPSGVLDATPFSFATRFENEKGTNPEELIAAAHAACFSMAFSNYLAQNGHTPESMETKATITLDSGSITEMHLETRGVVTGSFTDGETGLKVPGAVIQLRHFGRLTAFATTDFDGNFVFY